MPKTKNKNLLYYSVFDEGECYVELLYQSMKTIQPNNYDILILTDTITQNKINDRISSLNITVNYEIFPTQKDGIEASKIKLHIFQYKNIAQYDTILFLDADTLIIGNLDNIFDKKWKKNTLYTAYNPNLTYIHHTKNLYHGLNILTDEQIKTIEAYNQKPFNAGQFLFRNTRQMKCHFENVIWFMENWPDYYFFEQSFMNHYFCTNYLTDCVKFNKYIQMVPFNTFAEPNKDTIILHFIGPALNGKEKLDQINTYKTLYNV
jgi:lipopolysaccharide biosynthesis glycosyltransferase